jgi:long-chain acyl-CoA synthetase
VSYPLGMMSIRANVAYTQRLAEISKRFPERIAFRQKIHEGYREVSYQEFWLHAHAIARALASKGLNRGARVVILSENRLEWVLVYVGIHLAGGVAVPLDAQITPAEWVRLIEDSESRFAFVSGQLLPRVQEAARDLPFPVHWISFDSMGGDRDARAELAGLIEWSDSLCPAPALPEVQPDDVAVLIYTSGTTGKPKGVMLTHGNIMAEVAGILGIVQLDENDKLLSLLPLQHVFSCVISVITPLTLGAQVTFVDTLKRSEILEALAHGGITILPTVPQFFYLFHEQIQAELGKKPFLIRKLFNVLLWLNRFCMRGLRINLGRVLFGRIHDRFGKKIRLFVSGGSAFDPKVVRLFSDLGFTVLQGYGLTETSGACSATRVENNVLGSVGLPLPGAEMKIQDPNPMGVGEILVRGPLIMKGYYRNPEATSEAIQDGWFYTGDLGMIDARKNLFITGRKKEVIVLPNGKNIYPDEIEAHYQQCPYIKEIAVLGIATHGEYETSEKLHAVVVPDFDYLKVKKIANAREILRDEIGRWSIPLPKYKRLMSYQIQKDPLPRTTTRKIKRLDLKRSIESGELRLTEGGQTGSSASAEDQALGESALGQEVLRCLKENYHRDGPIDLNMNLELDLGFDSMERVELLSSLEESLSLRLPDGFGAEVFTLRELIQQLELLSGSVPGGTSASRQGWSQILSEESLAQEGEWKVKFSGVILNLVKYIGLRILYLLLRTLFRMEIRGREHIPPKAPFLISPNHLSYIDPFIVMSILPYKAFKKTFFVGASEYFETWYMKFLARLANIVPVDPDANLARAMKVGAYGLRQGRILCIFPEGARSFDGELKEFKKGAAILSNELSTPILPVGIVGAYEVWARGSRRIRFHKIKVIFGEPLAPSQGKDTSVYQVDTDRLRATISRLIRE